MSKARSLPRLRTEGVSKTATAQRLGLPRNKAKKYIRLFLAWDQTPEEQERLSDGTPEQMFLDMVSRHEMEDDPRCSALSSFFPKTWRKP